MKNSFSILKSSGSAISILLMVCAGLFCSCQSDDITSSKQQGYLVINVASNSEKSTFAAVEDDYSIVITDTKGKVVASYPKLSDVPQKITLSAGTYTVSAYSGEDVVAAFNQPYYAGHQSVKINFQETSTAELICRLANVRVTVDFSDNIRKNFTSYTATVTNGLENGTLVFKDGDINNGYFRANGYITWKLYLVNNNGTPFEFVKTIKGVEPRDYYKLTFDISDSAGGLDDGGIGLDVSVDPSTEDISHNINVILNPKPKPVFNSIGFAIGQQYMHTLGSKSEVSLNIDAQATLNFVRLSHSSSELAVIGLPFEVNLAAISEEEAATIKANTGLMWSTPISDAKVATISFDELFAKLPLGEHPIKVEALDAHNQLVKTLIDVIVLPDNEVTTSDAIPWAKIADIKGRWNTLEEPEVLGVEYKVFDATDWSVAPNVNISGKNVSCRIKGLLPETKYVARLYSSRDKANEIEFITGAATKIPNLNLESWSQDGKVWNPWGGDVPQFWDTGNSGVTTVGSSNTVPVDDADAIGGRAVRFESVWVDAFVYKTFAAGNLFTGTFKTNISDPAASVKFGKPYTAKPLQFSFYYKYKGTTINKGGGPHQGEPDQMQVYVSLEDWGGATTRPSNPTVVGYGEYSSATEQSTYKKVVADINYPNPKLTPTHIVFVATSSIYGGDFIGGVGSVLYLDEMDLLFE